MFYNYSDFIVIDDCMYISNNVHDQILNNLIMMFLIGLLIGLVFGTNSLFLYEYLRHRFLKYTHQ